MWMNDHRIELDGIVVTNDGFIFHNIPRENR